MTANRSATGAARVVLGVLVLAGVAVGQTKALQVLEPERRLALVIGNAEYGSHPLMNPVADAELIGATLEGLGFDAVRIERNLKTRSAMLGAVREFGRGLGPTDLAFFYYSGHGMRARGAEEPQDYLLPTEYDWKTAMDEVEFEALSFERVRTLLGTARVRVLVLDASRASERNIGLVARRAERGEFIAYATESGGQATDRGAGAGWYAQELAAALKQRGVEVEQVFARVTEGVLERSGGEQRPEFMPNLVGRLYLHR